VDFGADHFAGDGEAVGGGIEGAGLAEAGIDPGLGEATGGAEEAAGGGEVGDGDLAFEQGVEGLGAGLDGAVEIDGLDLFEGVL